MYTIPTSQLFNVARLFIVSLLAIELIAILILNNGRFIYTLDDAYIHLSVSEQIWHGNYGVNDGEFAAPSSSILFPFLLAIGAPSVFHEYLPLVLNVAALLLNVEILRIFLMRVGFDTDRQTKAMAAVFVVCSTLAFNLIGLVFSGMEHSVHVAITSVTILGLIVFLEDRRMTWWFVVSVILAPLIRYEGLALSTASIICVAARGHWKVAAVMAALIVISVGAFSMFLVMHGLPPVPTSVLVKSPLMQNAVSTSFGGDAISLLSNLKSSWLNPIGFLFALSGTLGLIVIWRDWQQHTVRAETLIAIALVILTFGHDAAGRFGWFDRYEIYAVVGTSMILVYLGRPLIHTAFETPLGRSTILVGGLAILLIVGARYIGGTVVVPLASNNIYEQQYQMHRFLTQYWHQPAAVNDLGWTSYRNNEYIFDLLGLGSEQARQAWSNSTREHLFQLVQNKGIKLAIVYTDWFADRPKSWILVGKMDLSRYRVTPAKATVDFYATNPEYVAEIRALLNSFARDLPQRVRLSVF